MKLCDCDRLCDLQSKVCELCHILKFTGCGMHLILYLGHSDLHELMQTGRKVTENIFYTPEPLCGLGNAKIH